MIIFASLFVQVRSCLALSCQAGLDRCEPAFLHTPPSVGLLTRHALANRCAEVEDDGGGELEQTVSRIFTLNLNEKKFKTEFNDPSLNYCWQRIHQHCSDPTSSYCQALEKWNLSKKSSPISCWVEPLVAVIIGFANMNWKIWPPPPQLGQMSSLRPRVTNRVSAELAKAETACLWWNTLIEYMHWPEWLKRSDIHTDETAQTCSFGNDDADAVWACRFSSRTWSHIRLLELS